MLRRTLCAWEKLVIVESPNKVIKVEGLLSNPRVIPDWSFGIPALTPISTGAERAIAMATTGHFMSLRELTWTPQSNSPAASVIGEGFPPNGVLSSFSLEWELIPGRRIRDTVSHYIEEKADNLTEIIIATDPDREGELIAVHAQNLIRRMFPDLKVPFTRAYMHSITEDGIRRAMEERHEAFDYNLANAAEARHAMDRIFGFLGSSVVRYANPQMRSIGRVQTPALILISDREAKIKTFIDTHGSSFEVQAMCHFNSRQNQRFSQIVKVVPVQKKGSGSSSTAVEVEWKDKASVARLCEKWGLRGARDFRVAAGCTPQENVSPPPKPFTMATLISKANRQLHYSSDMVSSCLQDLFQMGFITYPRTDSSRIDDSVLPSIYSAIKREFGRKVLQEQPDGASSSVGRQSSKQQQDGDAAGGNVEDAHEAIRPTNINTRVEDLGAVSTPMKNVYDMVRRNTLAAFMIPMRTERISVPITCKTGNGEEVEFQLQGKHVVEPGWTLSFRVASGSNSSGSGSKGGPSTAAAAAETETEQDVRAIEDGAAVLPNMSDDEFAAIMDVATRRGSGTGSGQSLRLETAQVVENKPMPPLPYSEGGLIEQLRSNGVGRPSTYPMIVKTLLARNYIVVNKGRCETTPVGRMLVETSRATFPSIVDIGFTADFEKKLDRVAKPDSSGEDGQHGRSTPTQRTLPASVSQADVVLSSFISSFLNYVTEATKAKRAAITTRSLTLQHERSASVSGSDTDAAATAASASTSSSSSSSNASAAGAEEDFQSTVARETRRVTAQVPDLVENMKMYRTFTALQNSLNDFLRRNFPASSAWSDATGNSNSSNSGYGGGGGGASRSSSRYKGSSGASSSKKRAPAAKKPKSEKKTPRRFQEKKRK